VGVGGGSWSSLQQDQTLIYLKCTKVQSQPRQVYFRRQIVLMGLYIFFITYQHNTLNIKISISHTMVNCRTTE
jgi:hypothetical protein